MRVTDCGEEAWSENARCCWRNSAGELNRILTIAYFDRLGLPRLS